MLNYFQIKQLINTSFKTTVAQIVKKLPAMPETQVRLLGQEDALEKGMATHSSILAWRILWTEEPGRLQSMGSQRVRHDRVTKAFAFQNNSSVLLYLFRGSVCSFSWLHHMVCGILVSQPGMEPAHWYWECGVSDTGPPGKPQAF